MSFTVSIVGRPNVGKSTFFNRLVGRRVAIVDKLSGVTRDRNYGISEWLGYNFTVIDTGGYIYKSKNIFSIEIVKQVFLAIKESNVILFIVDVTTGPVNTDYQLAEILRRVKKPVFLVVNKVDHTKYLQNAVEFYNLGWKRYYCISAVNGSGSGDLLDAIFEFFPNYNYRELYTQNIPRISIVGCPNAGKSTFINTLLDEQRHVVTDIPGTTRDSIEVKYNRFGYECILIDTAGIRKKSTVIDNIEFYSVMRSIRAIENSDVCLLILDAKKGFKSQDIKILHIIEKHRKGVVILINKSDYLEKNCFKFYEKSIQEKILYFYYVPILFISAKNKERIFKSIALALEVFKNSKQKIKTSNLNDLMLSIIKNNPPSSFRGKKIKIKFCKQLPTKFPKFIFYSNMPSNIKDSYRRFLEKKMRKFFNFKGVPLTIYFRSC